MGLRATDTILSVRNLTKQFGDVIAVNDVSIGILRGEIHCLLGENGAGKSTLAECLYGFYKPDIGKIEFNGEDLHLSSPKDAIEAGIGMVHQHFVLSPPMTVVENIVVGTQSEGFLLDLTAARRDVEQHCAEYGLDIDLGAVVGQLPVGKQQWVEILKALYVGVDLLILDEPTAVLTPQEVEVLFAILEKMKQNGLSIILITHKLHEVMSISDRVTVLRKGKVVNVVSTSAMTREELVNMMVGRAVNLHLDKEKCAPAEPILTLQDVRVSQGNGQPGLTDFTLEVRRNEIVGVAGVAGNGQSELCDVIVGVRQVEGGTITLDGEDVTNRPPNVMLKKGVASIPQDRISQGLLMGAPIKENLVLGRQHNRPFRKGLELNYKEIDRFAEEAIERFEIAASSGNQITQTLSGGNLQKVILARELSQQPKVVIASSPTRGLDVAATEYVHKRLVEMRDAGVGILLVSEDLDEIFNVSDRIAVIYRGQLMGQFDSDEAAREAVGLLMAGFREA